MALPHVVYQMYQDYIAELGTTWIEGCRGIPETFRELCVKMLKSQVHQGYFIKSMESLEDKAMALLTERMDFIEHHKVSRIHCVSVSWHVFNGFFSATAFVFSNSPEPRLEL